MSNLITPNEKQEIEGAEKFTNANGIIPVKCETTPPTETPFKDALCEYMEEYLEKIKKLRKNIKTIWNKNANK